MSRPEHDPSETSPRERGNAALKQQIEANDWKWLMSSKQGRRLVWGLLAETGIYQSSFTGNSETFFREGRRDIGLKVLAKIHATGPEAYVQMLTESKANT